MQPYRNPTFTNEPKCWVAKRTATQPTQLGLIENTDAHVCQKSEAGYIERGKNRKIRMFGSAKGLIQMADDFDAPLDDFKEYRV